MTESAINNLSQKQRDRLAFIEFRLWFLGDVSRRDLMERFGIAPAVATRDFTAYRELAPLNIDFEGRRRCTFQASNSVRFLNMNRNESWQRFRRDSVMVTIALAVAICPVHFRYGSTGLR